MKEEEFMLYDYVTAEERLEQLQPIQKCGGRSLFSRFKKNKLNRSIKKIQSTHDYQQKRNCSNSKEVRVSVLQCEACESVWINEDIQIVVLGFFKGVTHIGIEAPPETKIVKTEFKNKVQFNNDD